MEYLELLPYLGLSIESQEVKDLIAKCGAKYPAKNTCTGNSFGLKCVLIKNSVVLYFDTGFNCSFTRPIPAKRSGSYIQQVISIGLLKDYIGNLPFDLRLDMANDELSNILGEPIVANIVFETTTWRKNINDKMEIVISKFDDKTDWNINFLYNPDLNTMDDYDKLKS